jgi:hypothetical protein
MTALTMALIVSSLAAAPRETLAAAPPAQARVALAGAPAGEAAPPGAREHSILPAAGAVLACDLVAAGLVLGAYGGNLAAPGLLGVGLFVFGTPGAAVWGARQAGADGSTIHAYFAALGARLGGLAVGGLVTYALYDVTSDRDRMVLIPLLVLPVEFLLQPLAATRTLESRPRAPGVPSPADLARPVVDPATVR